MIAVTGSDGLLGRATVRELQAAGHAVRTIDHRGDSPVDLREPEAARQALAGCAAVVHLAALATPLADEPPVVWRDNVAMAANVMFAGAALGIRRIVYASSQSVLGLPWAPRVREPDYLPVDEDHPCRPSDAYSASKLAGEELARMLVRRGELDVRCLRFPVIWDPERRAAAIARRLADPAQGARSLWAYVDLRDAARGIGLALQRPWSGLEVLNLTACRAFAPEPIPDLVRRWLPGVTDIRVPLGPDTALLDWRRAEALLGFRARYLWIEGAISDAG